MTPDHSMHHSSVSVREAEERTKIDTYIHVHTYMCLDTYLHVVYTHIKVMAINMCLEFYCIKLFYRTTQSTNFLMVNTGFLSNVSRLHT